LIANIVGQGEVDHVWSLIADDVIRCLNKTPSFLSAGQLWQMCRSGQAFLIICVENGQIMGASVWRFDRGYERSVFDCLVLVGRNSRRWTGVLKDKATEIARQGGATLLTATGRVGLAKALKSIPGVRVTRQSYVVEVV
jgi:hypothetical protein